MLSQEVEEMLAERLVKRIEETNTNILQAIGKSINKIAKISPTQAHQLAQILKYGGSYEAIARELAKVTGKNIQEIYEIFDEVAKNNKEFAREFYRYRGIDFIPYSKDYTLQKQVRSIGLITANSYLNIAKTSVIGYVFKNSKGVSTFRNIKQTYQEIIDKAVLSTLQGKETFYNEMRSTLKQLGGSGLVYYDSGTVRRLDSAVRMTMLNGIRSVNEETSRKFGQEYDADGIEISVHSNPAPDHADIQGRQFSIEEFEKLENGSIATDVKGRTYNGADKRQIGQLNCYHKTFNIILGVSKPEYTDKELDKIIEDNEKGFMYNGRHYTNYQGTQLQRRIETEIRRQKDTQILAKSSGDKDLIGQAQKRITELTHRYNELSQISGLKPKKQRMSISGYRRTKV